MTIEVPARLEAALLEKAQAQGVTAAGYLSAVLERELGTDPRSEGFTKPLKTYRGIVAHLGPAPSGEVMDEERREMWKNFGERYP